MKRSAEPPPPRRHNRPRRTSSNTHRSTLSLQKTEILINVYDLLPPGRLSSLLWVVGSSLLHSGVVIHDREYAYGGHNRPGTSGVYWTRPGTVPPGGTFRCELLHGFTIRSESEIEEIIRETSVKFPGTGYNLLGNNCNHFTSYLCEKLTGRAAPAWLNRAASIGVALPCVVPREWIEPPEADTADGELLDEEEDDEARDERMAMLRRGTREEHSRGVHSTVHEHSGGQPRISLEDSDGRVLPSSERAPPPSTAR